MKKILAVLALSLSFSAFAQHDQITVTKPGMTFTGSPVICKLPHPTMDLLKVINDELVYKDYFNGYFISGYCFGLSGTEFTLKHKWKTTNKSYDGHRAEMWDVEMWDGEIMFAIILPDVPSHRKGTDI